MSNLSNDINIVAIGTFSEVTVRRKESQFLAYGP